LIDNESGKIQANLADVGGAGADLYPVKNHSWPIITCSRSYFG